MDTPPGTQGGEGGGNLDSVKLFATLCDFGLAHALQLRHLNVEIAAEGSVVHFRVVCGAQLVALAGLSRPHIARPLLQEPA